MRDLLDKSLVNLDPNKVREFEFFLKEYIETANAGVDVSKASVFYALVIQPAAMFMALTNQNVDAFRRNSSLQEVLNLPEAADPQIVQALLSNFGVEYREGSNAVGIVHVFLVNNAVTTIPRGAVVTHGELSYRTTTTTIGVPSRDLVSRDTDALIQQAETGAYYFPIPVRAENPGEEYLVTQGSSMFLQNPPTNYVSARAAEDFRGGEDADTALDLVERLEGGISGKTTASRVHVKALVEEQFPSVRHGSVIGMGHEAMTRDRNNIFRISYGGKSDIYLQTEARPLREVVTKTAKLVNAATNTWQVSFSREEFAGVYFISRVVPKGSTDLGSLAITNRVPGVDLSPIEGFTPTFSHNHQAAFSAFQTFTVEFVDTSPVPHGSEVFTTTREYDLTLVVMPHIQAIQEFIADPWRGSFRYDDVVRAPIPVFVSLNIHLRVPPGATYSTSAIRDSVVRRVNDLGFTRSLSSSVIVDAVHDNLSQGASVIMPVDMYGELVNPDTREREVFRSATNLTVPERPELGITNDTVMFFVLPDNVDIVVEAR